jgi:hypothetical protein
MAWKLIDADVLSHAAVKSLSAAQYVRLLKRLASEGHVGGIVFDAVIAEVARVAKADALLTLNVRHFRRVWSDADRIISPLTSSPPSRDAI